MSDVLILAQRIPLSPTLNEEGEPLIDAPYVGGISFADPGEDQQIMVAVHDVDFFGEGDAYARVSVCYVSPDNAFDAETEGTHEVADKGGTQLTLLPGGGEEDDTA